jgi:Trypsin
VCGATVWVAAWLAQACVVPADDAEPPEEEDAATATASQGVLDGEVIVDRRIVQLSAALTCTGVRITNQWVLTAAHCVVRADGRVVRADEVVDLATGSHAYDQLIVHPSYAGHVGAVAELDLALLHRGAAFDIVRDGFDGQLLEPGLLPLTGNEDFLITDIAEASFRDLYADAIQCEGFGGNDGRLRAAQFGAGTVGTYADRWLAIPTNSIGQQLTEGDSGGPCFPVVHGHVQPVVLGIASFVSHLAPYAYATYGADLRAWVTSVIPPAQRVEGLGLPTTSRTAGFDVLLPRQGRPLTLTGSTANAPVGFVADCGTTAPSPTVYYRLNITRSMLLYVDSFGSTFDTVLFLTKDPAGNAQDTGFICNDDTCGGRASQITQRLVPGTYFLGVSGYSGASGAYTLNVQHVPASGTLQSIPSIEPNSGVPTQFSTLLGGTTDPTLDTVDSVCASTGGQDWTFFFTTCPSFDRSALHAAFTASTGWDTVLTEHDGNASRVERTLPRTTCSDDVLGYRQSDLSVVPTPGAGVHTLLVDGYNAFAHGPFSLVFQVDHALNIRLGSARSTLASVGGNGGEDFRAPCDPGEVLVGIEGHSGTYLDQVSALCAALGPDGTLGAVSRRGSGGGSTGAAFRAQCPANQVAIGLSGRAGTYVDALGLECAPALPLALGSAFDVVHLTQFGGAGGSGFGGTEGPTRCGVGQALVELSGRSGTYVDRLTGSCAPLVRR